MMTDLAPEPASSSSEDRGAASPAAAGTLLVATAVAGLGALGAIKLLAAAYGAMIALTGHVWAGAPSPLRLAAAGHPLTLGVGAVAWYGANAVLAFALAGGLRRHQPWARWAAPIYGGVHAFGFAGLLLVGPIVLINGLLGLAIAVLVMVAGARGAFGGATPPHPGPTAPPPQA